jgi:hypothetical protein
MTIFLTQLVVFGPIHVFLQLSSIGLIGRKWASAHLENYDFQEVFLPKANSIRTEQEGAAYSCFYKVVFYWGIHVFFPISWIGLSGSHRAHLPLKTMICTYYSFQKVTQLKEGNNVFNAHASNIDGFPLRDICVSSTNLKRPTWNNMTLPQARNLWCSESICFKNYSILPGKECCRSFCF